MAELINIQPINPNTFEYQEYANEDTSLMVSNIVDTSFDPNTDYVEYFIYDLNNQLLYVNNLNHNNYKLLDNQLTLDPQKDLIQSGYTEGQYNTLYNIVSNKLGSSYLNTLYIQEISSDRTEIRLNTTKIPKDELTIKTIEFTNEVQNSVGGYLDFYVNFGNNDLVIANNILLDNDTVLIKLYEPLPSNFQIKNECWVVEKIANSVAYFISIQQTFDLEDLNIKIKGPNINLQIQDQTNNSTIYTNYNSLKSTTSSQNTGSFYYQLNSILSKKGINLNVDYTDYTQFINLSSALTRLENFYYKLTLIEQYQYSSSLSSGTTSNYYVSSSNIIYQNKINDIITNFDGYEYYLYFESSSATWPKSNSTPPFINYPASSITGQTWLSNQSVSASYYDADNSNNLVNSIPTYISSDSNNSQYLLFIQMLGQMFDDIWIYIKDVTNKFNSDNRLDHGISKDLVADVLRDLGFKLYQNNFSSNDLYSSYLGFTNSGSLYNLPNTSNSLPTNIGWEYINLYVTASATGSLVPTDDINKEIYKRIYHNLPYLFKTKGTVESLKTLITIFGIPETVLRVNEYGGKDKNFNTFDFWQDEYNYAYQTSGSSKISLPFTASSAYFGTTFPKALEFRFKTSGLPTSSIPYSQSLITHNSKNFDIVLEYTGSGYASSSYSGSTIDPYYQYATLKFISGSQSASVYLPFYNNSWWSVLINANSGSTTTYNLYVKNNIYSGFDGSVLGFQASSSFTGTSFWNTGDQLFLGTSSINNGKTYTPFSGSYQEIRYYNIPLSESAFNAFVMNPASIEGNISSGSQSSYNSLFFRLPLGGELYTNSSSIHPASTGSTNISSFIINNQTASFSGSYRFVSNVEVAYYDQPAVGIQNVVSNKIKIVNTLLPYSGSTDPNIFYSKTLSPYISIQQDYAVSSSYTNNVDYVEVAFSPQNEINEDIMSSLGYFNIGDYIGDPRQISSSDMSYPDLDNLRNDYFSKYYSNYNWVDYLRLIKFFDNSLFKTFQNFIPVKSALASGTIVKQHLLERNKYPIPQPDITQSDYTGSISMYNITGSDGGVWPDLSSSLNSQVTQSWTGSYTSYSGSIPFTRDDISEFFTGDLSGSNLIVTTQSLNSNNNYLTQSTPDTTLFDLSPYNVLINNVSSSVLNSTFFDADYSDSAILPTNQQLLLSGSANKFEIPDSNYTAYRSVALRYDGSKTTSPDFNLPIYNRPSSAFINNQYSITTPSTESQIPNASKYSNYFVYFDWIGGSNPQYPGGGNIHCTYLISTEGIAYPLTTNNANLNTIENIFIKGKTANILPVVYSAGNSAAQVEIVEGGALYDTIMYTTYDGSTILSPNFTVFYSSSFSSPVYVGAFITQSNIILTDTGSIYKPFLYSLLTGSSPISGSVRGVSSNNVYFYNKTIGDYVTGSIINYNDTYFPLQIGDIIRFGDTGSSDSSSLDSSFTALGQFQIASISIGTEVNKSSSITLNNINNINNDIFTWNGTTNYVQKYRIMRRIPNESFVLVKNNPSYSDPGFLVPTDFNPNYDVYTLARKAGIIT